MNRFISGLVNARRGVFPGTISGRTIALWVLKTAVMLSVVFLPFYACKRETQEQGAGLPLKHSGKTSAQPLPGGKARFSWVSGNFDLNGATWVRMANLSFTASSTSAPGTVAATVWLWQSDNNKDKSVYLTHTCTMRGYSKTCNTYTPGGWVYPAGHYTSWGGTYTYNTTTGVLAITWTSGPANGSAESWQISNPTSALARASLISGGYGLTHGRGYGSNAAWTSFKTISQIASAGWPDYTTANSKEVSASHATPTGTPTLSAGATSGQWAVSAKTFTGFTTATGVTSPAQVAHYDLATYQCSASSCSTSRLGKLYHLASLNTSRSMIYNMFCACLPQDNPSLPDGTEFPCYPRRLHPFAVQQIIDDNGNLAAMIAIEASHTFAIDPGSLLSLNDWNNIP